MLCQRSLWFSAAFGAAWAMVACWAPPAVAQSGRTTPAAEKQRSADEAPAGVAEFNALIAELQKIAAEMQKIQADMDALVTRLELAPAREQALIREQLARLDQRARQLARQGEPIYAKLQPAAEKAFLADPRKARQHTQHLLGTAMEQIRVGQFADAQKIVKFFLDHKFDDPDVYNIAAMAGINAGDDAAAEASLKKAAGKGDLAEMVQPVAEELRLRRAEAQADDLPRVRIETTKGVLVVELFENEAPNTVANFVSLVEKKFYDGLPFHRVLEGFMAQGGAPGGDGSKGPGYSIACECYQKNHRNHFAGSLSMAHAGRDTGGSQFFLTFGPTSHLDGRHTVFGRVIEGREVLGKIQRIDPDRPDPKIKPDAIVKATVQRKRPHDYAPKKLPEKKRPAR